MRKNICQILVLLFFINGIQAQNYNDSKSSTKDRFYENVKKADLTKTKTEELLKIIEERNRVLKDLDTKKKQADVPYSIQDPGTLYNFKINNARNYYARKINGLLTYKEYCEFAVDDYKNEAWQDAKPEYENLINNNAHLKEDQKQKLSEFLYNYHLNQLLTTAYYSFDKTVQKPKLGILRFSFEKEFKKRCKDYNIKNHDSNGENTNGFEWN
ncbi:hypothetical protein [Flavobacterium sp.]|uniref:hypothetical protein n=1 Tax=Flavobacterium sp. TaxID=239 RepID=UPI0031D1115E